MTAVHLPQVRAVVAGTGPIAVALEAAGYDGIWFGEVNNIDAVVPATLAAAATERAAIGTLLNTYTRAPTTLAMTAATLADIAPGRACVVLGVASPLLVERWNGIPYVRPFARLRDSLRFVRRALDGGRVTGDFETFATDGFALVEPPGEQPALLVAACGPLALELAATEADGVVLNWLTADDLAHVKPLPEDRSRISLVVPTCPSADRTVVEAVMRPLVTDYLNAPAYAEEQRRAGRGPALAAMWEAWDRGDRAGARAQLPSAVIDELVVWGSPSECRRRIAAIEAEAGVRALATYHLPDGADFLACATSAG